MGTSDGVGDAVPPGLRVVHFLHADNGRTIAAVVRCLAWEMVRSGQHVTILANTRTDRTPPPAGVNLIALGGSQHRTVTSAASLRQELRRQRPSVVFAHANGPSRALALATFGMDERPRLVGVEHNHYSSYAWNHRSLRDLANRLLLPRLDITVGVSDGVVEDLGRTFPRLLPQLQVVHPPLTRFDELASLAAEPVEHPWLPGPIPVVTSVGHVTPRKDHATLVRAMAHLRDVAGADAARLIVIGSDRGPAAEDLRRLIVELELSDLVDLVGTQRNPLRYVARSTIFALSSRNEGLGIAILEAMALGIPVVSTDCPSGPSFLLEGGARGMLVPVSDHRELGDALGRLLQDPDLRGRFSTSGRDRVDEFAPSAIAQRYLAVTGLAPARPSPGASSAS